MASVPKGLVLGLCVFAGFVVHGFLTKPPVYESAGTPEYHTRFNKYIGEYEVKLRSHGRWVVNEGFSQE